MDPSRGAFRPMKHSSLFAICLSVALATLPVLAHAQTILRASHQWPGGTGDVRDEMVQVIAREVEAADVDLLIRVYPGQSLLKALDQWSALVRGRVDIIALPLDYASGRHPQFSATLMPAWSTTTSTPPGSTIQSS